MKYRLAPEHATGAMIDAGERIRHGRIGVGVIYHHMICEAPVVSLPDRKAVRAADSIEERMRCQGWNDALAAIDAAMAAQQSADARDAARYRWLRERLSKPVPIVRVQIMHRGQYVLHESGADLDAAIDAAMAANGKQE